MYVACMHVCSMHACMSACIVVVVRALFHDGDHVTFISMGHQSHLLLHTQLYKKINIHVKTIYQQNKTITYVIRVITIKNYINKYFI